MKKQTANTVFFRYSPSNIQNLDHRYFESLFSDVGPVKKCSLIRSSKRERQQGDDTTLAPQNKGFGFIKFISHQDAVTAAKNFNGATLKLENTNFKIWVELADTVTPRVHGHPTAVKDTQRETTYTEEEETNMDSQPNTVTEEESLLVKRKKSSRVIVRNVSFYATEKNITSIMSRFGKVLEVTLPLVPVVDETTVKNKQPTHRGFAFVTFEDAQSARKAVEEKAPVLLKKRPLDISFSLSKFQHVHGKRKRDDSEHDDKDKEEEDRKADGVEKTSNLDSEDQDLSQDNNSVVSGQEDSIDGDQSQESENQVHEAQVNEKKLEATMNAQDHKQPVALSTAKYTLFLRNLPFDATRHDVFVLFQRFGHIESIYLVRDKDTGLGKGSAFVQFRDEDSFTQALDTGKLDGVDSFTDSPFVSSKKLVTGEAQVSPYGSGLFLNGRRLLVDKAIDRSTAESLKIERDEEGNPMGKKIGKDKRNLYLKNEGRVQEEDGNGNQDNAWENLPKTDQEKRGRAHQEKSVKLRSPLFFINPFRLSIRNLAKHVDEVALKQLVVLGITRGLANNLVTRTDLIAHWRAGGELTMRDIVHKISEAEMKNDSKDCTDKVIPGFNEKLGIKAFVPSIYIDRDFESSKGSRKDAPSRGFGFVEFTHHTHALACLRELNNNPAYSSEYVAGGRKAVELKRRMTKRKSVMKKKKSSRELEDENADTGDDGTARIPRLIVEFTVENKVMAKKQAEKRTSQLENKRKQQSTRELEKEAKEKKTKGRGALQRERKRQKLAQSTDK